MSLNKPLRSRFHVQSLMVRVILPQFLTFCLVLGALAYLTTSQRAERKRVTWVFDKVKTANLSAGRIRQLVSDKKKYLLSYRFEPKPLFIELIHRADEEIHANIDKLRRLNPSRRGQRIFAAYLASREEIEGLQALVVRAINRGSEKEIAHAFFLWSTTKQVNEAAIADLSIFNLKKLNQVTAELLSMDRRFHLVATGLVIALLIMVGLSGLSVYRTLVLPLWEMRRVADAIAGGSLDARVKNLKGTHEIEKLTFAINHMVDSLAETHRKLDTNAKQLAESNKELEQFAGVAAHDLRAPLRGMISWTEMLDASLAPPRSKEVDQAIGFVRENGCKLMALVDDILEMARVNASVNDTRRIELDTMVRDILSTLKQEVEATHAHVLCDRLPVVEGNSSHLQSLFGNLIRNALTYRDKARTPEIHIAFREGVDAYEFSVSDNGIGIAPQYTQRIFEMFNRLHNSRDYPGTGIGLAICKKVVELCGGRIWVDSIPGTGSTFFFTYPKVRGGRT